MVDSSVLIDYVDQFSYLGIFIISLLSGHLIPFPEDVILLISGYLASAGFINPYYAGLAGILGIFVGDNILYQLSKKGSSKVQRLREYVRVRLATREAFVRKHIRLVIFLSRFVPFFRSLSPVVAGVLDVPRKTFQFYNFLGMAIYVPAMVAIGYVFESNVNNLVDRVDALRHTLFIVLIIMVGVVIAFLGNRRINRFLKK
jgi:membrane protein DedA with SNARE-associated domain